MSWIEFLKRFVSDGEGLYGITIWFVLVFVICIAVIYMNYGAFKYAFGLKEWKRRFVAKFNKDVVVSVELPSKDNDLDGRDFKKLQMSLQDAIDRYGKHYEMDTGEEIKKMMRKKSKKTMRKRGGS